MAPSEIPVSETLQVVRPLALWFARVSRLDREDMLGVGLLAVVQQAPNFDESRSPWPQFCRLVARTAMVVEAEKLNRPWRHMDRLPAGSLHREFPEPGPFAVSALAILTDKQAETLSLSLALDGGEPRGDLAVAHMLGVSKNLVRSRVDRSLARLRKYLSEGDAA